MTITDTRVQELATQPSAALSIRSSQTFWDEKQYAALSALGIKGASRGDLAVFFHYCQRTRLDPFARQIYMIKRKQWDGDVKALVDKQTIQVGIDGFRVIRERAARRDGVTVEFEDTIWYDAAGGEHTVWLDDEQAPTACRVVLLKDGLRFPAVLRTKAYQATSKDGTPVAQWKMDGGQPDHMIEKCCEAFATRRAFPQDLGGVYLEEEMSAGYSEPAPAAPIRVSADSITASNGHASTPGPADSGPAGPGAPHVPEPPNGAGQQARPERPQAREQGGSGAPQPPLPGEEEDPTHAGSSSAGPARPPQQTSPPSASSQSSSRTPARKRPAKPLLGRVQGALHALPLGGSKDVAAVLTALCGRPVDRADGLYADECDLVLKVIDEALEAAGGDRGAAASAIWGRVAALVTTRAQDEAAEGQPGE